MPQSGHHPEYLSASSHQGTNPTTCEQRMVHQVRHTVRWGYNNVRIKEDDQWKAAFKMNRGLFEPTVMFFGLTNSPATFQTMMDAIFREEIASGDIIIYMDDVLIATNG